eukprot:TRINITY_DN9940_c0_g1_i1.p1 TRINITY_DN9940_c0_g1~~TRINITY_DN9940_c0_g1_i1.p1  ORF type:complete len:182 (-),score=12.85 TRINITY_DN9940_c0_g1_i1:96-578(-)
MAGRLKAWFEEQGLSAVDIPKAFVIHEVIGISFALAAWTLCYTVEPSKKVMRPITGGLSRSSKVSPLIKLTDGAMKKAQKIIADMKWLQTSWIGKRDSARLTTSLAESICFRAIVKPFTFTFKLWASWKLVVMSKPTHYKLQQQQQQKQPVTIIADQHLQ